jgi:hypothetical protein
MIELGAIEQRFRLPNSAMAAASCRAVASMSSHGARSRIVSVPIVSKLRPPALRGSLANSLRSRQIAELSARRARSASSSGQNKSASRSRRCGRPG